MANKVDMHVFHDRLTEVFGTLYETQKDNIQRAAELCAEAIEKGGVIQVFGSGHSVGFGMEMRNRPGSLVPVHSMIMSDFVTKGIVDLATFRRQDVIFERTPGVADKLYNLYDTKENDVFIIISNSGINGVVIDLAIYARQTGHKVIVVTSWQHTNSEASRHPSGKKLYEYGDVVIDNCGPVGDALLETGKLEKVYSISSITGAVIAQTIGLQAATILTEKGIEAPVLWDETREGYKEHNEELLRKYEGRINLE